MTLQLTLHPEETYKMNIVSVVRSKKKTKQKNNKKTKKPKTLCLSCLRYENQNRE